ncbi:MAG: hypothetical protein MUC85_06615 [Anaerolineales bacterium]|jgi:hypothetical protein|nr:hypothetical protein [Anaerolineales bacterium]
MLKTMGRILVILLAIGLVAGGLFWVGQNHPSLLGLEASHSGMLEERYRPGHGTGELFDRSDTLREDLPMGGFPEGGMRSHDGDGRLDSSRAVGGILRNILIIALITLLVVGIQKLYSWLFRRRKVATV